MVRTSGDAAALGGAVRDVVRRAAPHLPVFDMRPLEEYVWESRATQRFTMPVSACMA
jgi:hypothetical protein